MKVNIEILTEKEIKKRDKECKKLHEMYLNKEITFTEYSSISNKYFTEINLLKELRYIYGE